MKLGRKFKAALAITVFAIAVTPASAQFGGRGNTKERIARLESAVQDLQGVVYSVEQGTYQARPAQNDPYGDTGNGYGADTAVRVDQLERELQQLTGRVEELAYRMDQNTRKLDAISAALAVGGTTVGAAVEGAVPASPEGENLGPNSLGEQYQRMQSGAGAPLPAVGAQPSSTGGPVDLSGNGSFQGTLENQQTAVEQFDCTSALPNEADAIHAAADDALLSGEYDSSECALKKFLDNYPDDPRAPNATFRLGEVYLATGANVDAAKTFLSHIRTWPKDARAAESYLKLGTSYARLGKTAEACKIFGAIEKKFPNMNSNIRERIAREQGSAGC